MNEKSSWIIGMLWVSGFSIGAVAIGILALLYFDSRLASFVKADHEELLNDVRMAVERSAKKA